ncbi:MAG: prolyl oligopeptidase family serine peptidase [Planctomycetia bacterium]|nr:prolyl oligopeptidase family serine peptidase [Planctomycetia bacterium]
MPTPDFTRRQLLGLAGSASGAALAGPWLNLVAGSATSALFAADPPPAKPAPVVPPLNRLPRMVHDYYVTQMRDAERRGIERRAALRTQADAQAYIADVRTQIAKSFGPWPERTPLHARTVKSIERDAYVIENVIFESRPKFYVTANLYLPKGLKGKAPGVIGSCGHSHNGKAYPVYQSFAQGLARQGYVCLIFDPIGQGERLQLPDEHLHSRIGVGVAEHCMVGNAQFLAGEFFGSWRAWDAMRALDYLLTRPEVDPRHIGITGNSGGGTMTTWLAAVEPRWTMAAPSCFVTTLRRNLENELPADTEQCPPGILADGLDYVDFLAVMAPKPIAILAQEKDFFDVRGTLETFERLKAVYKLFGAEENVSLHIGPGPHGYAQDAREAMYSCFNRATGLGPSPAKEPKLTIEDEAVLQCTEKGQVAALESRTVYSFTSETAKQFAAQYAKPARARPAGAALRAAVEAVLKLPERRKTVDFRIPRPRAATGYPLPHATTYYVETEPGIQAVVIRPIAERHLSRPPRQTNRAILYVAHDSSDVELRVKAPGGNAQGGEAWLGELLAAEPESTLYAVDVRGLGDSRPNTCGENNYDTHYGCDYFYASHAIMLDRPYIGGRTYDLLTTLDFLADVGHKEVHLVARGYGTLPAAYAALLDDRVAQVTFKNALTSYADVADSDIYAWPLSSFTPNALKTFDLPDVYAELASKKKLKQVEMLGAKTKPAKG